METTSRLKEFLQDRELAISLAITAGCLAVAAQVLQPSDTANSYTPDNPEGSSVNAPAGGQANETRQSKSAASCAPDARLVNACRPWLGGYVNSYTEAASDNQSQTLYHEQRIGRQLDAVHTYHGLSANGLGSKALDASDLHWVNRPNTILNTNWKPARNWAAAGGGNTKVNGVIDSMASSIKEVAPHKIILSLYHEPENDISAGMTCQEPAPGASSGSPADYRAMWANVRRRFDAKGVDNVVWSMNYMGSPKWNCVVKDLWPGNNLVDWVMWDPYVTSDSATFKSAVGNYYDFLSASTTPIYDFASKPWAINEWNTFPDVDQSRTYQMYRDARIALDRNTFPRIRMYSIFDTSNADGDFRLGYTASGAPDSTEQALYNDFAQDPHFTDAYYTKP